MTRKAILAPFDGTPITRAAFVPADRPYQVCSRCVLDTTDPEITFDADGVCSHCHRYDDVVMPNWPWRQGTGAGRLERMIAEVKAYGTGKPYDCIIGMSGGVDSSYVALKVAEWKLRPLVVHVDAGWNSELAVQNIERICSTLGFDLVTHVVDWDEMKELQLAFLRSNLANQDVPQDHAFFSALYGYAEQAGIKYVINGNNYATEVSLPAAWGYNPMDATHLRAVHRRFGTRRLRSYPVVGFYDFFFKYPRVLKMKVMHPLNCIPYDKVDAIATLEREVGWKYYGGKHFESRWTRFFQAYYLPHKFGYDKRKAHLSALVLSGQISRHDALHALRKPLYDARTLDEDKRFIAKKLGIAVVELEDLIAQPPRHYTEFPNHEARMKVALWGMRMLRKFVPIRTSDYGGV